MSSGRQPQSGIRTLGRDWSHTPAQSSQPASSSQPIPWSPSPPRTKKPTSMSKEERLRIIQAALDNNPDPVLPCKPGPAPIVKPPPQSAIDNRKRPSPSHEQEEPLQKKRALPSSWDAIASSNSIPLSVSKPVKAELSVSGSMRSGNKDPNGRPVSKKPAAIFLSKEQSKILQLVNEGNSLFYTGSAGTGKSVLLREIIKTLRKKFNNQKSPDAVAVTASTGIAACNIGGVTVHSFAGIGLGVESAQDLATKIRKNKKACARWLRTKVLIIDEVSMLDGVLFDKLAQIACLIRKNSLPFGGIQVIVTGDFFQLPPVDKGKNAVKFAFEAEMWPTVVKRTFNLTQVFRQRDQEFIDMLNEMRFGALSAKSIARFKSLSRPIDDSDGHMATELFPRREDVDRSNDVRMRSLSGDEIPYKAYDSGTVEGEQREKLLANFMAPKLLVLRRRAQVMLIKNFDETLVNGSTGQILEFVDPATYGATEEDIIGKPKEQKKGSAPKPSGQLYPLVEFLIPGGGRRQMIVTPEAWKVELPNGEVQASRVQLPLILSWAMSIHKSQGQTLERVKVDLGKVFEKGQAYVALSRATSLEGLQVLNFNPVKVQVHPKVVEWSRTLETMEDE